MSGHSKWSQIKRKKGVKDIERGKVFSKISRLITLAVREGGGMADPEKNVKLRLAIERARSENMPKDNIERAISKASHGEGEALKEILYEGFGPYKTALLIETATDNPRRTHSEIRNVLERAGGKIGSENSVLYLFERCGLVIFDKEGSNEEAIFKFADAIGALDLEETKDSYFVYIPFEKIGVSRDLTKDLKPKSIEIDYKPKVGVKIDAEKEARGVLNLVESLESLPDVTKVFSNFDIPEKIVESL